jgi:hypothetical protein
MKKLLLVSVLALLLTGCSKPETMETVSDKLEEPVIGKKMEAVFQLPEEATLETMKNEENGAVYFCQDYVLTAHTTQSGDLKKTVQDTTGYPPENLCVIQTMQGDVKRYSFVWTAVGEQGQQVGRCVILDDGSYHYVLTAMADAEKAGILSRDQWQDVFSSYHLADPQDIVSSGS